MPHLKLIGPASDAGGEIMCPSQDRPTPLLTLPHSVRIPNVIPTDADPTEEVWATVIFRIWAPGTARHCRLCPRSYCRIYDLGLVEACSVGIDGYVGIDELRAIVSHDELYIPAGTPGAATRDEGLAGGVAAGEEAPPPPASSGPALRVLSARSPESA